MNGYGKVIALDKGRYTAGIFDGPCVIQEKIDGSQVSFGIENGAPVVRSKNAEVDPANKQFRMVLDWVTANVDNIPLGFVYRGEAVTSPRHNTLKYDRIPVNGVVIFDVYDSTLDRMLPPYEARRAAERVGLEYVQVFHVGECASADMCRAVLARESMLGGCKVEGVVIKRYDMPDPMSVRDSCDSFLKAKIVSEAFKEVHGASWKERNPNGADAITNLIAMYGTEARLDKAVQHLRDAGELTFTPSDIGRLIAECARDLNEECHEEIAEALWKHFGKKVVGGVAKMMPDHYKSKYLGIESE